MSELSIINGDILEKQSTYVKKYVDNGDAGLQKKIDQLSAKSTFSIKVNGETLPAVNNVVDLGEIGGGGDGGVNSVTAETTAVTSGTIASIANDTLKLKIPYTTTENGSHWLNVWNVTESKWDKISVDTLKIEV